MKEVRERQVEMAVVDVTVAVIYLKHLNSSPVHHIKFLAWKSNYLNPIAISQMVVRKGALEFPFSWNEHIGVVFTISACDVRYVLW